MAITKITTTRRAQSTPYNLRTLLCPTEKARDLSSPTGLECTSIPQAGTKRKRDSHASDVSNITDGTSNLAKRRNRSTRRKGDITFPSDNHPSDLSTDADGLVDKVRKRVRRAYRKGDIILPSPNRRLLSLPTPDRPKLRHDFTAGGIPPDELVSPDLRFLWRDDDRDPPEIEWIFDPELGRETKNYTVRTLPERDGAFGAPDYREQIQGWCLLLKRYCGRPVSPVQVPEPSEMTYREWEQFARPVGLLLEAVEGVENVYDAVTGK